jgi:hypothetical protein
MLQSEWWNATWERRQVSVFKKDDIPSKELINKILEESTPNSPVFVQHWHHEVEIYGPEYEEDKLKLTLQGVEEISIRRKYDIRSPFYDAEPKPLWLTPIQDHFEFFLEEIDNGNIKKRGLKNEDGSPIVSFNTQLLAPYLLKFKFSPNIFIPKTSSIGKKSESKSSQWEKYVQTSISHAIVTSIVAKHYGVDSGFCGCFILSDNNPNRIYSNERDVLLFLGLGYADPERCYKSNYGDITCAMADNKKKTRASYTDICTWK